MLPVRARRRAPAPPRAAGARPGRRVARLRAARRRARRAARRLGDDRRDSAAEPPRSTRRLARAAAEHDVALTLGSGRQLCSTTRRCSRPTSAATARRCCSRTSGGARSGDPDGPERAERARRAARRRRPLCPPQPDPGGGPARGRARLLRRRSRASPRPWSDWHRGRSSSRRSASAWTAPTWRCSPTAGVAAVDVAGAGGTNWALVEGRRDPGAERSRPGLRRLGRADRRRAGRGARRGAGTRSCIASGGVRDGVDVAKCLALGAGGVRARAPAPRRRPGRSRRRGPRRAHRAAAHRHVGRRRRRGSAQLGHGARCVRVAVIGAGLGGLATALRLQGAGHDVVVRRAGRGGRADAPGSSATAASPGTPGRRSSRCRGCSRRSSRPAASTSAPSSSCAASTRSTGSAGTARRGPSTSVGDLDRLRAEIAKFSPRDALALDGYLAARAPDLRGGDPRRRPAPVRRTATSHGSARRLAAAGRSPHALALRRTSLQRPARPRGVLVPLAVHRRRPVSRARDLRARSSICSSLDDGWYANGGVYSVVEAMARPLDVRYGERVVARSNAEAARVSGVVLEDGERSPPTSSSHNADVLRVHELLGRRAPLRRLRPTMSCLLLYLGTDRRFPQLRPPHADSSAATTASSSARRDARPVAAAGRPLDLRSRAVAHRARDGTAGWRLDRVLLPVANLSADPIDWGGASDRVRDALLDGPRARLRPRAPARRDRRRAPHDSGRLRARPRRRRRQRVRVEPTLHQRPASATPQPRPPGAGLYHVGAGTHPGAGIPGVLLGAEVTAGLVARGRPRPATMRTEGPCCCGG